MRHKLLFFSVLLGLVLCGGAAIAWSGHTDAAHAASPTSTVIATMPVGSRPVGESDSWPRAVALTATATASALLPSGGPTTLVKTGVFAMRTSTGSQSVTGVGFKPKVLILFGVKKTADGFDAGYEFGFGATDETTEYSIAGHSRSNEFPPHKGADSDRAQRPKAITFVQMVGEVSAEADLTSFDDDGFTLDWTTASGYAWIVHYLAIGGDNIESDIAEFEVLSGSHAYTHVGFKPDLLLLFGAPSSFGPQILGLGFVDSLGNQFAMSGATQNWGTTPRNAARYQRTDKCFVALEPNADPIYVISEAEFVSMDSLGFTLAYSGPTVSIISVAIKGVRAKVGALTSPASSGDQAITGVGFSPRGALLAGFNKAASASVEDSNRLTVGVADANRDVGSVWVGDTDNEEYYQADQATYDHLCYFSADAYQPTAPRSSAIVKSWDADGFSLSWTIGSDFLQQVGYLLIGDYSSGPVAPVGGIAEPPEATLGGASGNAVPIPMVAGLLGVAGAMLAGALGAWRVYSVRRR